MKHKDHEWLFESSLVGRLCGCVHGVAPRLRLVADLLRAASPDCSQGDVPTPEAMLRVFEKADRETAALVLMELLGLTEHGTSANWSWLTEDGQRMLRLIDGEPDDDRLDALVSRLTDHDPDQPCPEDCYRDMNA